MRILVTSDNSGLIETVRNTISIHSIKKDAYARRLNEVGVVFTLYDYFQQVSDLLFQRSRSKTKIGALLPLELTDVDFSHP